MKKLPSPHPSASSLALLSSAKVPASFLKDVHNLSQQYGFKTHEFDFFIHCSVKYRLGDDLFTDDEAEEDNA